MREHQLRAILFSDIVGFSRQMATDEARTLATLARNEANHQRLITQHNGQIIDTIGDGHLCLFSSSLDAVYAGLALQHQLAVDGDATELRIGIHVGDTVVESRGRRVTNVYGDCVNIAARIESNAPEPGVWVSARVAADLRSHSHLSLASAGEFALKNIPEPMELFAVQGDYPNLPELAQSALNATPRPRLTRWLLAAAALVVVLGGAVFALTWEAEDAETLVVLPLEYIGADDSQAYLAEATTARLQSAFVDLANIKLVSQSSAERLENSSAALDDVEVDYFLEGRLLLDSADLTLELSLMEADSETRLFHHQWRGEVDSLTDLEADARAELNEVLAGLQ